MTPRRLLFALAAGALAAGCSAGPDQVAGRAAPAGAPAAPTSTPAPTSAPAGTGSPAATPSRSGGARPPAVPASVMLRGADWPGGTVRESTTGVAGLEQTEPSACQARTAFPSDRHRLAARTVSVASDEPESGGVYQVVVRYAPGRAAQALAEMRRVLAACPGYGPAPDVSPPATRTYRLEDQRFTGDDALLIRRADRSAGDTREWATAISVVRIGDAVVTTSSEIGEGGTDPALARRLATAGAERAACLRTTC